MVQSDHLIVSSKYFEGVKWEINRPLQRPTEPLAKEHHNPLKPEFSIEDARQWIIEFNKDLWEFKYVDYIKKEHIMQEIDPYSAYNNGKIEVKQ